MEDTRWRTQNGASEMMKAMRNTQREGGEPWKSTEDEADGGYREDLKRDKDNKVGKRSEARQSCVKEEKMLIRQEKRSWMLVPRC